jgi:hypothetical protein
MTAKARGARQLVAELWNVKVEQVRQDAVAIRQMYHDLEQSGYQWVTAKQSWALIAAFDEEKNPYLRMTVACDTQDSDEVAYLLSESFNASGFQLARMDLFIDPNLLSVTVIEIEVVR